MPIPKKPKWVTFDVYGTLIDWETGVKTAFATEAKRSGFEIEDPNAVFDRFVELQHEIESGSYELYAEVLRRVAMQIAEEIKWDLEPSRAGFLPDSVLRWRPFKETNLQLGRFAKKFDTGLISNIDDRLLGETRRYLPLEFGLVVTAQQVRSYKPEPAHFKEFARRVGGKKDWVHICCGYEADVLPALKAKIPVIWVNRTKRKLEPNDKKPTAEVKTLLAAAKLLGAA